MVTEVDGSMTSMEQKRAAAWIRGLVLLSTHRYVDAAANFQFVANAPEFAYTEAASRWLAVCLSRSGRGDDANGAFDRWVRRYRPGVNLASRVLQLMGHDNVPSEASNSGVVAIYQPSNRPTSFKK
jgi:hypothetical protein